MILELMRRVKYGIKEMRDSHVKDDEINYMWMLRFCTGWSL
jgi:hypothetical protein